MYPVTYTRHGSRISWFTVEGSPHPLGATWIPEDESFNFALYSKHARRVTLLLFEQDQLEKPCLTFAFNHLVNKSGRIWHCRIPESLMGKATYYAYQIDGPYDPDDQEFHAFDPEKLLLDPYARQVYFPETFDRAAAQRPGSNLGKAPLGVLLKNGHCFDWGIDQVRFHEHDLIIYELHVRGFTKHPSSGVSPDLQGTYLGVIEKIPYLKELGITAVELLPIFQFDPAEGNFWGYMPLNFFSPHAQYAFESKNAANEFRHMVKALHEAGIEVLLDVVFNHTCEGNEQGPTYSFKAIDNSTYYMSSEGKRGYANFSGTGNTLHTKNRFVTRMVLDSMRMWVEEYHVDGFRFDLAAAFNRHADGSVSEEDSRLIAAIRADPVLGKIRLIAEPWDAAGLVQLGRSFPGKRWFQWNGMFRDTIRQFVKGDPGLVPETMRRLYGSDDLFPDSLTEACHPYQNIHYVDSHDGFTLYDQVAYNERHNLANGENNQDGHRENHSWNCGWEGDVDVPPDVIDLRVRQAKNFCCLVMLANGTPMWRAGDEFLQTQYGNNNPYNQDNEISWLDWSRQAQHADFHRFFKQMIAFRKSHPTIARSRFWRSDVHWYGSGPAVDMSHDSRHFAYHLRGHGLLDSDFYVMINADWQDRVFEIQAYHPEGWVRVIDTSKPSPDDVYELRDAPEVTQHLYQVAARSVVVLLRTG